jgi:hypothetical protein
MDLVQKEMERKVATSTKRKVFETLKTNSS